MRWMISMTLCGCSLSEEGFASAYERERCWYLRQCEGEAFDLAYDDLGDCTSEVDARAAALVEANAACVFDPSVARGCLAMMHKLVDSCSDQTLEATAEPCDVVWTCTEGGAPGVP